MWSFGEGITHEWHLYEQQQKRLFPELNRDLDKKQPNFMFISYIYYYDKKTKQVLHAAYWASRLRKYCPGVVEQYEWYCYGSKKIIYEKSIKPQLYDNGNYKFANFKFYNEKNTRQNIPMDLLNENVYLDVSGRGRLYKK